MLEFQYLRKCPTKCHLMAAKIIEYFGCMQRRFMVQVLKQGFRTTIYTTNLMTTVVVFPPPAVLCNNNKGVGAFMEEKYREGMNVLSSMQFQFRIQILFILSSSVLFLSLFQLVVACIIRPLYICIQSKIDGLQIPRRERCMHSYFHSPLVGAPTQEQFFHAS